MTSRSLIVLTSLLVISSYAFGQEFRATLNGVVTDPSQAGIGKDRVMAAHGAPEYSVAEGNDYAAHEQTYRNFISLVKWVGGFVVLIVVGMAIFLT